MPILKILIHFFSRENNSKFKDENVVQYLNGVEPVQFNSCLNINFGSGYTFSFSQMQMVPDGLGKEKIRNNLKNNVFNCYIVSVGKIYIQVENEHLGFPNIKVVKMYYSYMNI